MRLTTPLYLLSTLAILAPSAARADASTEVSQNMNCTISGTALILSNKQKTNFTGSETGFRLTFTDGSVKYKIDMIWSYMLANATTSELIQTRVGTEPGQNANETFADTSSINYWIPFGATDMSTVVSNGLYRYTQKDANTTLITDMNPDKTKKNADESEVTSQAAPGVQKITTKLLGANPASGGVQVLAESLACTYAPTTIDQMPGTDFYAAVPNAVDSFRQQFNATVAAEAAAAACKAGGTDDCEQLAAAAVQSQKDRDAAWQKMFQ